MKKGTHPFLALGLIVAVISTIVASTQDNSIKSGTTQNLVASDAQVNSELLSLKEQGDEQISKLTDSLNGSPSIKEEAPQAYLSAKKEQLSELKSTAKSNNQICLDLMGEIKDLKALNLSDSAKAEEALKLFAEINLELRKVCSQSEYTSFFNNDFTPWISSLGAK